MKCKDVIAEHPKICKLICTAYSEYYGVARCMTTVTQGMDASCTRWKEIEREAKYGRKRK